MELHKSKLGDDDRWRAFTYSKCKSILIKMKIKTALTFSKAIPALRNYPRRIQSFSEARSIRGVGDRTAQKVSQTELARNKTLSCGTDYGDNYNR